MWDEPNAHGGDDEPDDTTGGSGQPAPAGLSGRAEAEPDHTRREGPRRTSAHRRPRGGAASAEPEVDPARAEPAGRPEIPRPRGGSRRRNSARNGSGSHEATGPPLLTPVPRPDDLGDEPVGLSPPIGAGPIGVGPSNASGRGRGFGRSSTRAAPAVDAEWLPPTGRAAVPTASPPIAAEPESTAEQGEHDWLDKEAGPVVRPYTVTGGRARPVTGSLDLLSYVEALYAPEADLVALQPEHRSILAMTRTALSLAEIAAHLDLPVGVVRVLIGDLVQANLVSTFSSGTAVHPPDESILQAVIDGLRAL